MSGAQSGSSVKIFISRVPTNGTTQYYIRIHLARHGLSARVRRSDPTAPRPLLKSPSSGNLNYLLGTKVGTYVRTHSWSFALPEPTGGTHDESQTDRRCRGPFYCARRSRDCV